MSLEFPKNNIIDDWLEKNKPMTTEINRTDANRTLILAVILAILLTSFVWWLLSKPSKPIVTKGSFPAVVVKPSEVRPLPELQIIHDSFKTIIDSSGVTKFRKLYNLTKSENDSLIVANNVLDSLAQATNDKYFQKLYSDCKSVEFSHIFKKDTLGFSLNATVSGISRGAPERLKLDYEFTLPKEKKTAFALWGGLEAGMRKSFDKFNAKANLDFQIGESTMIKTSFDTDTRIYLGVSKSIFSIKK